MCLCIITLPDCTPFRVGQVNNNLSAGSPELLVKLSGQLMFNKLVTGFWRGGRCMNFAAGPQLYAGSLYRPSVMKSLAS